MCAAPNLVNFPYWHAGPTTEHQENSPNNNFPNSSILSDPKSKMLRRPMLIVNNFPKSEIFPPNFDKTYCEPMSFLTEKLETKHFLAPLGSFQVNQGQETNNDMQMKRCPEPQVQQHHNQEHGNQEPPSEVKNNAPVRVNNINNVNAENSNQVQPKLRPYSCNECGKTFLLKHHLTTHEKTHTGERPHACVHCGKAFTHKHCLNTHLLLHNSQRPYQCPECKKCFTLKHHLLTHTRVHNREKPFTCTDCGQSFPLKRHLVTHSKFHAGERPYVCEECGESFAQKDHLVMHSRFHGFLNSFVCSDCGATFTRKFELVNHGRLHGRMPHTCPICNKEFLQKRTLVVHMRYHTGESPFACLSCGESFHTKNDLNAHTKLNPNCSSSNAGNGSTNSVKQDKLSCQECGSAFNSPEALALHIKLHTGDTSLVNDLCTLTASLQNANFPLAINGLNANLNFNLHNVQASAAQHNTTNNTQSTPTQKVKSHFCRHCSKAFSAKHGLHQHNKRHPDGTCALKSHICPTCNKGFYQKNHLLLHQRQHMDPALRDSSRYENNQSIKSDKSENEENNVNMETMHTKLTDMGYGPSVSQCDLGAHMHPDMNNKPQEETNTDGDLPRIQPQSEILCNSEVDRKDI